MTDHKFDGKILRFRGSKIGSFDGKVIRDAKGTKVGILENEKIIRDSKGNRIATVEGDKIRDLRTNTTSSLSDIRKQIDGTGGSTLAALWLLLIK